MPRMMLNDAAIYYEEHGNGDETIVFAQPTHLACVFQLCLCLP